jgi:predicted outer membrane repeat protein
MAASREVRSGLSTAILALALAAAGPASAAVLTVASCGDTGAQNQLRDRINDAAVSGDTINVPACVITLTGAAGNDSNASGDLDIIGKSVTIVGAGPGLTIIDGGGIDRVFHVLTGSSLTLIGMTIRNGNSGAGTGGGIFAAAGTQLTLIDVVVSGNQTAAGGGGIRAEGSLALDHVIVRDNSAGTLGGGIITVFSPGATITNSVIADNRANLSGGGIYNQGPMTLAKVSITGNRADQDNAGGGAGGGLAAATGQVVTLGVALARNTVGTTGSGPDCAQVGGTILAVAGTTIQTNCSVAAVLGGNPVLASDVVVGAGAGGGPHVRVLDPATGAEVLGFFAYDAAFAGGVQVAACALGTTDGVPEIVTGAGPGGGPHVKVFNGATGALVPGTIGSFFAYDVGFTGGVAVGCADVNLDGVPDVITGAGPGGGPHVRAFSGLDAGEVFGAFVYPPAFTGGVFVGP